MNKLIFTLIYAYQRSAVTKGPIQQSVAVIAIQLSTNILSMLLILYSAAVHMGFAVNPRVFPNVMIPGVLGYILLYVWMNKVCESNSRLADELDLTTEECRRISLIYLVITVVLFACALYVFAAIR